MEHGLVTDIAICIIAAWILAVLSQVARQPVLLAYLVAGFVIGPHGFQWITKTQNSETISEIGLSLLLFMIGLEIDLKKMLSAGRVILLTAAAQILGCVLLGWIVFGLIGPAENRLEALYLGVAAAMSSTVIIVKILYDKRELETLAGRITLGVLVLQDIAVILFLALQPNLKNPAFGPLAQALGNVILLVAVAFLAGRFVLPPVFKLVARLPELVLVGAVAWCFTMAGFANWLGLSTAMGALIAGVMVSTFPYTLDVVAKVTSIRDFFVTLFFVGLGMKIPMPTWSYLLWTIFFCLFLVGSRLATVFPPLYFMRQGYRVSLLSAINLCQMSELSILQKATPWLNKIGFHDLERGAPADDAGEKPRRICLLGFSWTASSLLEEISRERPDLLSQIVVVDFNPNVYEKLRQRGVRVVYGDITQRDTLHHAGVSHAEVIICSLPNMVLKGADNLKMLRQLRELNSDAKIVVHAELLSDIPVLYAAGANYVTAPRLVEAADLLRAIEAAEKNLLDQKRKEQENELQGRDEV